jgi:hypothetical protein
MTWGMAIDKPSPFDIHHTPLDQKALLTQEVYFDLGLDAQSATRDVLIDCATLLVAAKTHFSNE